MLKTIISQCAISPENMTKFTEFSGLKNDESRFLYPENSFCHKKQNSKIIVTTSTNRLSSYNYYLCPK